jgi:hypothetical protein
MEFRSNCFDHYWHTWKHQRSTWGSQKPPRERKRWSYGFNEAWTGEKLENSGSDSSAIIRFTMRRLKRVHMVHQLPRSFLISLRISFPLLRFLILSFLSSRSAKPELWKIRVYYSNAVDRVKTVECKRSISSDRGLVSGWLFVAAKWIICAQSWL